MTGHGGGTRTLATSEVSVPRPNQELKLPGGARLVHQVALTKSNAVLSAQRKFEKDVTIHVWNVHSKEWVMHLEVFEYVEVFIRQIGRSDMERILGTKEVDCSITFHPSEAVLEHSDDVGGVEITPAEAAKVVDEQWASMVEMNILHAMGTSSTEQHEVEEVDVAIVVLTFHRHPKEFDLVLCSSALAQRLRTLGVDVRLEWANGAKIFVPDLTEDWLSSFDVELCPRNVVVLEKEEDDVYRALDGLPFRIRPRSKPGTRRVLPRTFDAPLAFRGSSLTRSNEHSVSSEDEEVFLSPVITADAPSHSSSSHASGPDAVYELIVDRTFFALKRSAPHVRDDCTRSTGDAHGVPNPRAS